MRLVRPLAWPLAVLAIAGCGAADDGLSTATPVTTDRIEMHDDAFDPPVVEVEVGTTVTWAFTDNGRSHNVVGDDFESDVEGTGTFAHTFTSVGTYDYTCTLHSGMDGRIIVRDA